MCTPKTWLLRPSPASYKLRVSYEEKRILFLQFHLLAEAPRQSRPFSRSSIAIKEPKEARRFFFGPRQVAPSTGMVKLKKKKKKELRGSHSTSAQNRLTAACSNLSVNRRNVRKQTRDHLQSLERQTMLACEIVNRKRWEVARVSKARFALCHT